MGDCCDCSLRPGCLHSYRLRCFPGPRRPPPHRWLLNQPHPLFRPCGHLVDARMRRLRVRLGHNMGHLAWPFAWRCARGPGPDRLRQAPQCHLGYQCGCQGQSQVEPAAGRQRRRHHPLVNQVVGTGGVEDTLWRVMHGDSGLACVPRCKSRRADCGGGQPAPAPARLLPFVTLESPGRWRLDGLGGDLVSPPNPPSAPPLLMKGRGGSGGGCCWRAWGRV
mmetsp:Transcript_33156/g.88043  ORF Transcript_33156/g.88043 Transcript_33156/m.88043 type:complete len:221 (-) Transcript_33156:107-769(-)